ncbi:RHOB [Mytilus coruscus]|uniref:RHOB n=1 Tax=Mytilus coruscus TaxID=42192 RepID=A0A6J8BC36_MYTCO|nr:RHOB [Mytilus coruscus]
MEQSHLDIETQLATELMGSINLLIVGDSWCGKSALIFSMTKTDFICTREEYSDACLWSIFEEYKLNIKFRGADIIVNLQDIVGLIKTFQEEFHTLVSGSYQLMDVVLVAFNIFNPASFGNVDAKWLPEVHHYKMNVPRILYIANLRYDNTVYGERQKRYQPVEQKEIEALCKRNNVEYFETSAMTGGGVEACLLAAVTAGVAFKYEKNKIPFGLKMHVFKYEIKEHLKDKEIIDFELFRLNLTKFQFAEDAAEKQYREVLQSGVENRYMIRLPVVGPSGVGKTCLTRKLLRKQISDVTSTNGIEIMTQKCKVCLTDDTWIFSEDIHFNANQGRKSRLIKNLLVPPLKGKKQSNKTAEATHIPDCYVSVKDDKAAITNANDQRHQISKISPDVEITEDEKSKTNLPTITAVNENYENTEKRNSKLQDNVLAPAEAKNGDLFADLKGWSESEASLDDFAEVALLDFAGRYEFYATHQTFLNKHAIYLLVLDVSKNIKGLMTSEDVDENFLYLSEIQFEDIGEYINFWMDAIHCYGDDEKKTDKETRKWEIQKQFDQILGDHPKRKHIKDFIMLSNTTSTESDFDVLRNRIVQLASKVETWGQQLPTRWIKYEQVLDQHRENQDRVMAYEDMKTLGESVGLYIEDRNEMNLFFKYQHDIGNLIYFEDIPELIWKWGKNSKLSFKDIWEHAEATITGIKGRYKMNVSYTMKMKCCNRSYDNPDGMVEMTKLESDDEYFCDEHAVLHNSKDLLDSWFKEELNAEMMNYVRLAKTVTDLMPEVMVEQLKSDAFDLTENTRVTFRSLFTSFQLQNKHKPTTGKLASLMCPNEDTEIGVGDDVKRWRFILTELKNHSKIGEESFVALEIVLASVFIRSEKLCESYSFVSKYQKIMTGMFEANDYDFYLQKVKHDIITDRNRSTFYVFIDALRESRYDDIAELLSCDLEDITEDTRTAQMEGLSAWTVPLHKVRLQKNYVDIISTIKHEAIVDHLISCELFTIDDQQIIQACPAQTERNRKLMDTLLHCGEKCFIEFLNA